MKSINLEYGELNFEISLLDDFSYKELTTEPVENADGAIMIGWCKKPSFDVETLYVFPIIDKQISWQTHPRNAILIPDFVQERARLLI